MIWTELGFIAKSACISFLLTATNCYIKVTKLKFLSQVLWPIVFCCKTISLQVFNPVPLKSIPPTNHITILTSSLIDWLPSYTIVSSFKANCRTKRPITIENSFRGFCTKFILHHYRSAKQPTTVVRRSILERNWANKICSIYVVREDRDESSRVESSYSASVSSS